MKQHWRLYGAGLALGGIALAAILWPAIHPAPRTPMVVPVIEPAVANEPPMRAIRQLVATGDLAGATSRLGAVYRFDQRHGLGALQQFSMLVLERGLYDPDPFERYFAAAALARGGRHEGVALLVRGIRSNPDLSLKMAAADGLGDVGDDYAVDLLQRLYYSVGLFDRRIVVNAIADAEDPAAIVVLSDAVLQRDPNLRLTALQGLGRLGDPAAAPLLRRVVNSASPPIERAMAATSLLKLGQSVDPHVLEGLLADRRDGSARAIAALALGFANDPQMVPVLKQAIKDEDADVRLAAAAALTHYDQPAGVAYLKIAMVDEEDPVNRRYVAQLLDQVAFRGGYEVLLAATGSVDPNLQISGVRALGLAGGAREADLLGAMLRHTADPLMRAQIAWSLGRLSQPGTIGTLIQLVQEQDPAVRYTAADALDRTAQRLVKDVHS